MKHLNLRLVILAALLCCIAPIYARSITFPDWTSTNHDNNSVSSEEYNFTISTSGDLSFNWQVSSESGWDWLIVLLDGVELLRKSGSESGSYVYSSALGTNIAQGSHTLVVKYTKDSSNSNGNDLASVSNIVITTDDFNTEITFPDWTSTNHENNSVSSEEYTFVTLGSADLSFNWQVSSESNYDWLIVLLDGEELLKKSGALSGSYVYSSAKGTNISRGSHTLVVKYTKDGSQNSGSDNASVSNIVVTSTMADDYSSIDGVYYSPSPEGTACVIGIVDTVEVAIRDVIVIDGVEYSVTAIDSHAFSGYSGLESITIPSSITSVGDYAFDNCTGLKEVIIADGNNTLSLGYNASSQGLFYDCPLENVYLGRNLSYNSNSSYGYSPFYDKDALTTVIIGDSITSIASYAFYDCDALASISFPMGVSSIGTYAFYSCDNLALVSIPESMISIGSYAFQYCNNLSKVFNSSNLNIVKGNSGNGYVGYYASQVVRVDTIIDNYYFYTADDGSHYLSYYSGQDTILVLPESYNGENYAIGDYAFYNCISLDSIAISSGVLSIGNYAFSNCANIEYITIPSNVTSIGNSAFDNCNSLKYVVIENSDNTLSLGYNASSQGLFYDCPLESVYIGRNLSYSANSSYGYSPFYNKDNLTSVIFSNNVTSIGAYAFSDCGSLRSITISKGITSIGNYAFRYCNNLSLVFNASNLDIVKGSTGNGYVGSYANRIVETDDYIGDYYFETTSTGTHNLIYYAGEDSVLTLPQSYHGESYTIGNYAFHNCRDVVSISISDSVVAIGDYAFSGCSRISSIVIPSCVNSVGNSAFNDCTNLKDIVIASNGNTLTLGYNESSQGLFYDCPLENVYWGRNLSYSASSSYGYSPFYNKDVLTSVVIGDSVTAINDYAFYSCDSIASVVLPKNAASIGTYAFSGCGKLEAITIPSKTTSIGNYAFDNCVSLKEVNFEDGVSMLSLGYNNSSQGLFYDCPLETVHLGRNLSYSTSYGYSPFYNKDAICRLTIGDSLTTISSYAFYDCDNISSVTIPHGVTSVGSYAFYDCDNISSVTIPQGVTSIGSSAFYSCDNLTFVAIPASITSIGSSAFYYCTKLSLVLNSSSLNIVKGDSGYGYVGYYANQVVKVDEIIDDYYFYTASDGTHFLSYYAGQDSVLILPENYNGEAYSVGSYAFYNQDNLLSISIPSNVASIGNYAFYSCDSLTAVTIPETISSIGSYAFSGCGKLSSITIPSTTTSIGNYAFDNCVRLKEVNFEDGVSTLSLGYNGSSQGLFYDCPLETVHLGRNLGYSTSNGYSPFYNKDALTSVVIGDSVTAINDYAFYSCDSIASIVLPKNMASIGNSAFSGCGKLGAITIPSKMTSIGNYAFDNCVSLKEVNFADGISTLSLGYNGSSQGLFYDCPLESVYLGRNLSYSTSSSYGYSPFYNEDALTSVVVGDSVSAIGAYAFYDCGNLSNITIPSNISSIGSNAFYACNNLLVVFNYSDLNIVKGSSNYGYVGYYANQVVQVGDIVSDFYFYTADDGTHHLGYYSGQDSIVILPQSYQGESYLIGDRAFYNCSNIVSISIPDSVVAIGSYAFYNCSSLDSISLPENIASIGSYAFFGCEKLSSIVIPAETSSIGNYAFDDCTGLKDVSFEVSGSTLTLGNNGSYGLFYDCPLESLYVGRTLSYSTSDADDSPFYNKDGLTSVVIGDSVSAIGAYAFYDCDSLVSVAISENVSSIGIYAFAFCDKLSSITIPSKTTSIGDYAFVDCLSLKELSFEDGGTTLTLGNNGSYGLFYGCPLESLYVGRTLSYSISDADDSPFYNKDGLTSVVIGDSVSAIGSYAFYDCNNLAIVSISDSVSTIGNYAFGYCNSLDSIAIPSKTTSIGNDAFSGCSSLSSIVIPSRVTSIGNYAFDNCTSLKDLVIEDGSGALSLGHDYYYSYGTGRGLFYDCPLESVYIGRDLSYSSGSSYGYSPFYNEDGLTSVVIGDSVSAIGSYAFYDCGNLTSLTIPKGISSINDCAFLNCGNLSMVINHSDLNIVKGSSSNGYVGYYANQVIRLDDVIDDYYFFYTSSDSTHYLSYYSGQDSILVLPDSYHGEPYSIGNSAFYNCSNIVYVSIPDSVVSIGDYAFYNCSNIDSIAISSNITSIGNYAFYSCDSLATIAIPRGVTSIGIHAFSGCGMLSAINIPSTTVLIGDCAFENCTKLKEMTFEDGGNTLSLGYNSSSQGLFYDCPLESVYLGRNLSYNTSSSYGYSPFYNKDALATVVIGDSVTSIANYTFYDCDALASLTIGENVTSIGGSAFYSCSNLVTITIPEGITSIGSYAFNYCNNLSMVFNCSDLSIAKGSSDYGYVGYYADQVVTVDTIIGDYYFYTAANGTHYLSYYSGQDSVLVLPDSYNDEPYSIGDYAFNNKSSLSSVIIPSGTIAIGGYAFSGCSNLSSISIPSSVTSVGYSTFDNCTKLKEVTFEDGGNTLSLGYNNSSQGLFYDCPLESVYLGRDLSYSTSSSYGYSPFYNKDALTTVVIGDSVTSIANYTFYDCDALASLTISENVTTIGSYAFYSCSNLATIIIPEGVTSIGGEAFYNCENLRLVFNRSNLNIIKGNSNYGYVGYYANQVVKWDTIIDDYYFYTTADGTHYLSYYSGQDSILVLPNSYNDEPYSIDAYVFNNHSSLSSITIPSVVLAIGEHAFSGCSQLFSISIPSSVTSIGNYAFDNCTSLKEVTFEDGGNTLSLGYNGSSQGLFYDCPLEMVHLGRNLGYNSGSSYGYSPFYNKDALIRLTIGEDVTSINDYAFYSCDNIGSLTIGTNISNIGYNVFSNLYKVIWMPNTPPVGYNNISASLNYVSNQQQYESLSNTQVYPYLSSSFDVDGVKYVPLNPSERTCCVLDCAYDSVTTTVNVGESLSYRGVTMQVEEIAPYAFANNKYIREVIISHRGNIGDHAFYNCDSIQSVHIYNQGNIGSQAFYGCESLETAVISNITSDELLSDNVTYSFSDWTSSNHGNDGSVSSETYTFVTTSGGTLQFDWSVSSESNFDWLTVFLDGTEILRRSGVYNGTYSNEDLSAGEHSLVVQYSKDGSVNSGRDQANISNIVVANSGNIITSEIGSQVFENCSSLKYVTLGDSVKTLGNRMFKGCTSLQEFVISDSVIWIGDYCFQDCSALSEVTISQNTQRVGNYAFSGCTSLQEIAIPDSVVWIGDYCFQGCSALSEVTISQSAQYVGNYAFSGCSSLLEFSIPQSLMSIGDYAFDGCSALSEIVIPSAMKDIGYDAFRGCTSLSNVIIENRTDTLNFGRNGSSALFADCPLDSVYIGGKIAGGLSENATRSPFYCNTSLRTVVIANKEDLIYDYEFYGCTNLRRVDVGNGVSTIGDYAFSGCSNLQSITLGSNMESLGTGAFSGCVNLSSITSSALVPPSCSSQALDDIKKWECYLYIPINSASAYQEADQWKDFFHIYDNIELEKYRIAFVVNGEVVHVDSLAHKDIVTMIDEPVREGYTFSGWDKTLSFMLAEDVEINGTFSANIYEMKYVVDGDVLHIDSIAYGTRVELVEEPVREGYTFSGWENVCEVMPAYDIVIEGRFLINKYQVTYIIGGEIVYSDSIEYGMSIVTPEVLERPGYTLSWGDVLETMPAMDLVYQGEYVVNKYMLSFWLDGELYAVSQMEYGDAIALPDAPEIEGYTFSWGDVPETMPAEDVVCEGCYVRKNYLLVLIIDGGLYGTYTLEPGADINLPEVPMKEGYTFSWEYAPGIMPMEDVVCEGHYTANTYKVSYYVGQRVVESYEVAYGESIPEYENDSTAEIVTILGWEGDVYETMPAHDVVYTAIISNGVDSTLMDDEQLMIYDLSGRRVLNVDDLEEGFYIVNGKKTWLKKGY